MRRTITIDYENAYYRGKMIGYIFGDIRRHFDLESSETHKYVITITESKTGKYPGNYQFAEYGGGLYALYNGNENLGVICIDKFSKLFFRPLLRRKYNITVKKVEIKK